MVLLEKFIQLKVIKYNTRYKLANQFKHYKTILLTSGHLSYESNSSHISKKVNKILIHLLIINFKIYLMGTPNLQI